MTSSDGAHGADEISFVDADGAVLEVHRYAGDADGPTLVFLHEGLGSAAMWRNFPGQLAGVTKLAAIVYSRRGYGNSAPRSDPYTTDFMHDEARRTLPALLSALAIQRPLLVGHSDGGSIALIHAADHPVAGLIVEAPHIFVEDICVDAIAQARETFRSGDLVRRLGRYHKDPEQAFRGWNDIWLEPDFRAWNIEDIVGRVKAPILAIQGETDQYGTMAQIDGIAATAAGPVQLLKLPDCGHAPHRDQPKIVLREMKAFIKGLRTPP